MPYVHFFRNHFRNLHFRRNPQQILIFLWILRPFWSADLMSTWDVLYRIHCPAEIHRNFIGNYRTNTGNYIKYIRNYIKNNGEYIYIYIYIYIERERERENERHKHT